MSPNAAALLEGAVDVVHARSRALLGRVKPSWCCTRALKSWKPGTTAAMRSRMRP